MVDRTDARPRLLAVSSARRPCGIADYHTALVAGFAGRATVTTAELPDDLAPRSRPVRLLARRRRVRELARRADEFDAVLVQYHPRFWNHIGRRGEDLFPLFLAAVRRPVLAVVHEPTDPIREAPPAGSLRTAKRAYQQAWALANGEPAVPGAALAGLSVAVVHTPGLADWVRNIGLPADRVVYTPHPVFPPPAGVPSPADIDRRFGLAGKRVVAVAGFPDRRKGFDLVLRAMAGLPTDVVLVWAGGGTDTPEGKRLAQLATSLGVADQFIRLGYVDEPTLYGVLSRATVAAAPFREAAGSGSVARLLGAGVPVVASDLPSFRDLQAAGADLTLVPADDPVSLATGLASRICDPGGRAGVSRRFAAAHSFATLAEVLCPWSAAGSLACPMADHLEV